MILPAPRRTVVAAALLATTALLSGWSRQAATSGVSITFLANEGVLLSGSEGDVLIDALFGDYGPMYAKPADSTRRQLAAALPPFNGVRLVLVTHRHGDHFHPEPMTSHLLANRSATLATSAQVIDSLRRHPAALALPLERLRARTTPPGTWRRETLGGITVDVLGLPHGGDRHRQVEHVGFIVHLGNRRVLHVGDTDISEATFAPFRLDTARIDVALLPQWMLTSAEGRRVIAQWIRPRQVVAFHLADADTVQAVRETRAAYPEAVVLATSLTTLRR